MAFNASHLTGPADPSFNQAEIFQATNVTVVVLHPTDFTPPDMKLVFQQPGSNHSKYSKLDFDTSMAIELRNSSAQAAFDFVNPRFASRTMYNMGSHMVGVFYPTGYVPSTINLHYGGKQNHTHGGSNSTHHGAKPHTIHHGNHTRLAGHHGTHGENNTHHDHQNGTKLAGHHATGSQAVPAPMTKAYYLRGRQLSAAATTPQSSSTSTYYPFPTPTSVPSQSDKGAARFFFISMAVATFLVIFGVSLYKALRSRRRPAERTAKGSKKRAVNKSNIRLYKHERDYPLRGSPKGSAGKAPSRKREVELQSWPRRLSSDNTLVGNPDELPWADLFENPRQAPNPATPRISRWSLDSTDFPSSKTLQKQRRLQRSQEPPPLPPPPADLAPLPTEMSSPYYSDTPALRRVPIAWRGSATPAPGWPLPAVPADLPRPPRALMREGPAKMMRISEGRKVQPPQAAELFF